MGAQGIQLVKNVSSTVCVPHVPQVKFQLARACPGQEQDLAQRQVFLGLPGACLSKNRDGGE